jgi:hypothetical protein
MEKPADLIFGLDERPPLASWIGLGFQNAAVMCTRARLPRKSLSATAPTIHTTNLQSRERFVRSSARHLVPRQQSTIYPPQHSTCCGGSRVQLNTVGCRRLRTRKHSRA